MRIILSLLCVVMFVLTAKSQINEGDTSTFQLRASLTGNFQKGNVELTVVRSKLDFSGKLTKGFVFKSQNSTLYQKLLLKKVDNDLFSRNWLHYKPEQTFSPFLLAYISTNFRRKIELREFGGVGLTWQPVNNAANSLRLSIGTIYETTRYKVDTFSYAKYNGSNTIDLWRFSSRLGGIHYFAERHIRFYYEIYFQPSFSDSKNYRWQGETGLDFTLIKGLAFNVLYGMSHENVFAKSVKDTDRILTFGLSYALKINKK